MISQSRIPWLILALLFFITVITSIDRVNISVTAHQMMPAYDITDQQMGWIFSAFALGYALFQIPGGWLADRWDTRIVLTVALVWWSICTLMTPLVGTSPLTKLVGGCGALMWVRFFLGIGEAVALPTCHRVVTNWFPTEARGFAIGVAIGGIGLGSAITPPLAAWVMINWGWQTVFYLTSPLGIGMGFLWWLLSRNHPHEHPWIKSSLQILPSAKLTPPVPVPWRTFSQTPTIWWLFMSYSCLGYVVYIFLSWFYLYLVNIRQFDMLSAGKYAVGPFLAMLMCCPLGGWVTDRLAFRYGVTTGRTATGMAGMGLAGLMIAIGGFIESPILAIASLSLGAGWLYFSVSAYWTSTSDLSQTHAGALSGLMNTGASIGGAISPTLTPWLAHHFGWPIALGVAAAVAIVGGLLWIKIDPGKGLNYNSQQRTHTLSVH